MKLNTAYMKNKTKLPAGSLTLLLGFCGLISSTALAVPSNGINNAKKDVVALARDPFWPVGYQPARVEGQEEIARQQMLEGANSGTDWNIAMNQVIINGVSSRGGNEYVAVINNEVKLVGESVSIWFGGTHYTWKVKCVSPSGSVELRRVSAQ
jgi:hypothetical protein